MSIAMSKYNLISRNIEEVIDEENIKNILQERPLNIYWGTATTGKPHLGYFVPMRKIADFLVAGCEVTILFANLHGLLDGSSYELLESRTQVYKLIIMKMLEVINAPTDKLKFVVGTDFQLTSKYSMDMYKLTSMTTYSHVSHAGSEVVKNSASPYMSSLLYPILQSLDEEYLNCDVQFGGVDQRKIFMFAREWMPKIGYRKRSYIMNPLLPGLTESGKMSSSEPGSKIDFDDSDVSIRKKISKLPIEKCKLLVKYILESVTINGIEHDYMSLSTVTTVEVRDAVTNKIITLIKPIRDMLNENLHLLNVAYPTKVSSIGVTTQATIGSLDIIVGKILSLVVSKPSLNIVIVMIGDKNIAATIGNFNSQLINENILVVTNLAKKSLFGFTVEGEIIDVIVPDGTPIGERLSFDVPEIPDALLTNKRFDRIMSNIKVHDGVIIYKYNDRSIEFVTSTGTCKSRNI